VCGGDEDALEGFRKGLVGAMVMALGQQKIGEVGIVVVFEDTEKPGLDLLLLKIKRVMIRGRRDW
jgi:hypothetical protein